MNDIRKMKDSEIIKRALKYVLPHWKKFLLAFLMLFINVALNICLPLIISNSTEKLKIISQSGDKEILYKVIILAISYFVLTLINIVMQFSMSVILQKTGQGIVVNLRDDVFEHIENLSILQLNDIPVGKLVTRVTNDTAALSDMFSNLIVNLIKDVLMVVITFFVMFVVNAKLSIYMLIFIFLVILVSVIFKVVSKIVFRKEREQISVMNSFVSENLSGMKVIQVYNQEERIKKEFDERNKKLQKASYNVTLTFAFYRPMVSLIYFLAIATCFQIGVPTVNGPTFLLFYLYLSNFFEPIQNLADLLNGFQRGFAAAERLFLLMDIESLIKEKQNPIVLDHLEGNIEFDHVYFAYNNENWVLKDVSFKINKGETVAFVGQTGAGKTTILSLIVRNYDIQKGHIYIDGYDIKDLSISSLRKQVGQMLQEVFLFSGDIKSNIRLRNDEISDAEIYEACQYVHADKFISKLKHKYEQKVQENGNNFSTGERQLLSFARTIIRKPSILILDEATANIDTESEVLIQESLKKMKSIGTMLIVAHRLSTIRNADKIIVIENGSVTEKGTHEELMRNKGYYYKLCSLAIN